MGAGGQSSLQAGGGAGRGRVEAVVVGGDWGEAGSANFPPSKKRQHPGSGRRGGQPGTASAWAPVPPAALMGRKVLLSQVRAAAGVRRGPGLGGLRGQGTMALTLSSAPGAPGRGAGAPPPQAAI